MKKRKILILGSSGQIGSHLFNFLSKKKYKVSKFDLVDGSKYDIRKNSFLLKKSISNSDYIFFLAFDVGGSRYLNSYQNSFDFLMNNLKIMTNVFDILNKTKKPFLFASSQMSNMIYSNYGILKFLGEKIAISLNGNYVKFWNVYGIENNLHKSHVITDFILMSLKKKKIKMLTDGNETRKFLYAEDCSECLEIIMKKHEFFKKTKNELHVTSNKDTKIIDIANIIKDIAELKKEKIKIIKGKKKDKIQFNKKNKNNNYLFKYWKPKTSVKQGILKIFDYYHKNLK